MFATRRPLLGRFTRIKEGLNTIDKGSKRVVEVKGNEKGVRNAIASKLSADGKAGRVETHGAYPEHVNPNKGEYRDVHVQTENAAQKAGCGALILAVVAPYSQAESENSAATTSSIVSAWLWDLAKAIDPLFLTDGIEKLFNVTPSNEDDSSRKEEKKDSKNDQNKDSMCDCGIHLPPDIKFEP